MNVCPQCHRPLKADAPAGLCPACLLGLVRSATPDANAPTLPMSERLPEPALPSLEKLATLFPQFRSLEWIGQGGMGAVYKAYQPNLDRYVAIKILSPRFANDPSFAERFTREARTLARLTHQNIINVFDFGQQGSVYYLIMEYVDGVNLREAMRAGTLSAEQALAIVPQVCEALQFAHDEGIIHRDIKPENILLDRRGRVKIADFGLAKLVDGASENQWTLTGSRQVLGTLNYMAPEQIEQPNRVDHRADIYSLGVVLYELLTGELPLGRFPLPSEKGNTPADLDQVVLRTLEKEPDRRYQRASEVRTAVESAWAAVRPAGATLAPPMDAMAPAAPQPHGVVKRSPRVPFSVVEPHMNLMITHGVLRIQKGNLEIDYSAKENIFKSLQLKSGQHIIPLRDVLSMTLRRQWFSSKLEMTLDRPLALTGLPTKDSGKFELKIELVDHVEAWRLVNAIREAIGQPLISLESTGYVETKGVTVSRSEAQRRTRWPAAGLIGCGVLNFLCIVFALLFFKYLGAVEGELSSGRSFWEILRNGSENSGQEANLEKRELPATPTLPPGVPNGEVEQDLAADTESPVNNESSTVAAKQFSLKATNSLRLWRLLDVGIIMVWGTMGFVAILAGLRMLALTHGHFCFVVSLLACIPLHPGVILGMPSGIWAMVVLSQSQVAREFQGE